MDFGLKGRCALVCAASRGLGRGVAGALAAEGVTLVINGRDPAVLEATAAEIRRASGVTVEPVIADVTTEAGRRALLAACPAPDILVNNAGGPPPGDVQRFTREDWLRALDANMLAPIALIQATLDGMIARGFGRVLNITSSAIKFPGAYGMLGLSLGARSGLTGAMAALSRQVAGKNVTVNNVLPGRYETDRLVKTIEWEAKQRQVPVAQVRGELLAGIPAGRFGTPEEFGAVCAFLCSVQASYITAQNLVLDGGCYPGLF